jgi:peptidoglycan/xylan/chitin deacetylase (PgdA/CDA1 family)
MTKAIAFLILFALTHASLLLLLFPFTPGRLLATTALYVCGNAFMLVVLFHPQNRWLADHQTVVRCGTRPCVALTFDDGPSPEITPRVLEILRERNVKATFFSTGSQVERHPDLARLVTSEGHVIGNHTYSHPQLFCFLTPRRLRDEIERAQQAISQATGVRPRHFRSPVGLRHPLLAPTLDRASLELVLWQIRTYDTRNVAAADLRRRILDRVRPGAIVLLHDRSSKGSRAMLAALPDVIDRLRASGYEFVTI